ncbi:MAG TPA: sigma-70 family RNA polymerase sigma factor [Terracidiphilus sp.]|jgi:RNA polymerase sigma-70 factor (ECF subfamily)
MRDIASSPPETAAGREFDPLVQFREGEGEVREAAFEALFRRHQRAVRGWILRIVRDGGAADELTVETFWRIYRARDRFEPERGFEPWARRIATRAALDWLRAQKPEFSTPSGFFEALPAGKGPDPAISEEIRRKTALAFGRLRPPLRVAATLAVIEERPHKEVAAALGISVTAVKLRVFRALRLLRKDLELQGIEP